MEPWLTKLHADPTEWLLGSNPWTRYQTLLTLLETAEGDPDVIQARKEMVEHPLIRHLVAETADWMPLAPTRNNDATISHFKLKMLADVGFRKDDPGMEDIIEKASAHIIEEMYAVKGTVPERPKKGEAFEKPDLNADVWHIAPCNSPEITHALLKLGVDLPSLTTAVKALQARWTDDIGWFCHFFFVESQFRKEQIGCPVAGLKALEVFSLVPELKEAACAQHAFEPLRFHYQFGKSLYYFGRSKKFWTLKYPFVWYNALYLADVLTRFSFLKEEPVVKQLIDWILTMQDKDGRFRPTSVFMAYKGWDFGNKKEPSPWITYICCRILKQYFDKE